MSDAISTLKKFNICHCDRHLFDQLNSSSIVKKLLIGKPLICPLCKKSIRLNILSFIDNPQFVILKTENKQEIKIPFATWKWLIEEIKYE